MELGDKKVLKIVAVFTGWLITSFLCHKCGKSFLDFFKTKEQYITYLGENLSRFLFALILTAIQCVTCFLCVTLRTSVDSRVPFILRISHALATLATNYSMAHIEAASTHAIKMTEPVTMVIVNRIIFKTAVSVETIISIPTIIAGVLIFSIQSTLSLAEYVGIGLSFASNIVLAARNVAIKSLQLSGESCSSPVILRLTWQMSVLIVIQVAIVIASYVLERLSVVPVNTSLAVVLLLASGIFHVAYSYISTNVVLKVMDIVSHSVANIFKRVLVVLMLYLAGRRHASLWNISGLALALLGLFIYLRGKRKVDAPHGADSNRNVFWSSKFGLTTAGIFLLLVFVVPLNQSFLNRFDSNVRELILKGEANSFVYKELNFLNSFYKDNFYINVDGKTSEFLSWHLVDHPEETDSRAKTLSENVAVVAEAQRVLINLLTDLIGPARHVMLMEIAVYENKGDPAISAGEVLLLRKMNKTIVYYCETNTCAKEPHLKRAVEISKQYGKDELVILMQGGGNLVGYAVIDDVRIKIIQAFPDRKLILLSQSIWLNPKSAPSLENARKFYSNNTNLILFLRDRQSLAIAKENFKGVKHILAPDMAFGIGMVPRQLAPFFDIVWLRRRDKESSNYTLPAFSEGLSVHVSDWALDWKSNKGSTDLEQSFLIAQEGFNFLQRGRVVVTDRLHGHILSTLLDIPHVIIDNSPYFKLSSFDKSWTAGLSNVIRVDNGSLALTAALELLRRFDSVLPQIGPKNVKNF